MLKIFEALSVLDGMGRELCLFVEMDKKDDKVLASLSIGRDGKKFGNFSESMLEFNDLHSAKKYLVDRLNIFKLHKFTREFKSDLHPIFSEIKRKILDY
jgi:hypothetical protein